MTVYFTSPFRLYGTERYGKTLQMIKKVFPDQEVFEPCRFFVDQKQWALSWPSHLDMSDSLVFMTDEDGWIGRGTYSEVRYANRNGKSVEMANEFGTKPLALAPVLAYNEHDWTRCVRFQLTECEDE